jgi:hypothetical protein
MGVTPPGKFAPKKPLPNPPEPTTPPPQKKSDKPCGIGELIVKDKQGRVPGPGKILQVTPEPDKKDKVTENWLSLVEISKSGGGTETLSVEVKSKEPGRKQACLLRHSAVDESDWKDGPKHSFTLKHPENKDKFPSWASGERYYVYGRGCDEATDRVLVEVFPSQNYKVKIDINEFAKLFKAMSGGCGSLLKYFLPASGDMSDEDRKSAKEDADYEEGRASKTEKVKGVMEVSWGWQEEPKEWRVFFLEQVTAGLDPLFSIGWKPKISFAAMAYSACGIPPPAADLLAEHLFDVYLQFELGFEVKVVGTGKYKQYTYGDNAVTGSIEVTGTGKFGIVIGAKLGSTWVVAVIVEGAARSEIGIGGELEFSKDGITLAPKVEIAPVVLSVTFKVKAFTREAYKKQKAWEVGGPWRIYPPEDAEPFKIYPRPEKTPATTSP